MAKDNKKSAAQQAAAEAAEKQTPKVETPKAEEANGTVVQPMAKIKGLSQEAKVSYLASVQTERAFIMNSENPSQSLIDGLTMISQSTILDVALGEIASGTSAVGHIMTINEKNYDFLKGIATEMGISLPEFKALPAPTKEQLANAGLLPAPDQKMVVVSQENVSKEAKEKKKKEMEVVAKAVENPAEITNNEQLKASLTAMLVKPIKEGVDRVDARVQRTIKFYRGYLTIQANKAENKEEALKAMKEKTMIQLLNEIAEIVGPCPFFLSGTASWLRKRTIETGSPISAYCLYRRGAIPGENGTVDDQYVADTVRTLIIWSCKSLIAESEKSLKSQKKLVKTEEGNAKVATETAIRYNESVIKQMNEIIEETTNAKFDLVDHIDENYSLEDKESEDYKLAHRIADDIVKTYYPVYVGKEMTDELMANIKQRAGIVVNMFRDPLSQSISYAEANLTEMKPAEEKPAEEETKN